MDQEVREIREVMVNPNGRLIFEDEKTTLVVKAYKDLWSDREVGVEMPQEVKGSWGYLPLISLRRG